jgi:hypothetical protein
MKLPTYQWMGQMLAALGVIASLVLVGLQLNQNADLLRIQLLYEETGRLIQSEQALYGEEAARIWAKSINSPRDLKLEELRIVEAYLYSSVEMWRATHMLSRHGLLDAEDDWKHRIVIEAPYLLGNEYGSAWWSVYREEEDKADPEFILAVDEALAGDPKGTMRYQLMPMSRLAAEEPVLK